jgi:hypothetical protein
MSALVMVAGGWFKATGQRWKLAVLIGLVFAATVAALGGLSAWVRQLLRPDQEFVGLAGALLTVVIVHGWR